MHSHSDKTHESKSQTVPAQQSVSGRSGFYLRDNRGGAVAQKKQLETTTNCGIVAAQRKAEGTGLPIQLVEKKPVITGTTKATTVALDLKPGDYVPAGSTPSADPDGYDNLRKLGLTKPAKFIRFHVLNQHSGGPGNKKGNLTSTSQKANTNGGWKNFEGVLKNTVVANQPVKQPVAFQANVQYPSAATTNWINITNGSSVKTNAQDYPDQVDASLDINGATAANAHLGVADGLYGPQNLGHIPKWEPGKKTMASAGAGAALAGAAAVPYIGSIGALGTLAGVSILGGAVLGGAALGVGLLAAHNIFKTWQAGKK